MKKILSIAITAIFLLQNLAFAQVNNASEIINCSKNPEDAFCKSINITKEEIPLKNAILNKHYYAGNILTIENKGDSPIEITKISNEAPNALKKIKDKRKDERFPRALAEPIEAIVLMPILIPIGYALGRSQGNSNLELLEQLFSKEAIVENGYLFFVQPAKGTILIPYYLIKDSIDDKKIARDLSQYKTEIQNLTLNPKEKIKVAVLGSKYKFLQQTFILINDTETGKMYRIEK